MGKAPAFQFYANDFMDATSMWEANAVGLYVRCLCKQWTHGSIPSDLKILARAIHCDRPELETCWPVLAPKFIDQGDGTLKNSRLEEVRNRQTEISEERSKAGKAGAIARANAKANEPTKDKQRKVKEKEKIEEEGTPFESWWKLYGKGSRKLSAEQWDRMPEPDRIDCIAKTPAYIASKPDPIYRKDGERFLKHRTWEDAIVANGAPAPVVHKLPEATGWITDKR